MPAGQQRATWPALHSSGDWGMARGVVTDHHGNLPGAIWETALTEDPTAKLMAMERDSLDDLACFVCYNLRPRSDFDREQPRTAVKHANGRPEPYDDVKQPVVSPPAHQHT
nr:uncharacterized protein CTRU02_05580 [Colletotrichum truncatum]KAF6794023.1 hypothetical protein CTRU02_05580 [Colletotrichum truncatum]